VHYDAEHEDHLADAHPTTIALAAALQGIDRSGDFCAEGVVGGVLPRVDVEGFGPVPFPFPPALLDALASRATPAPYGRGVDTLVDPEVRRCLQIEADNLDLPERVWGPLLSRLTAAAAEELGVPGPVDAELYKLLIYQQGDFFLPHRDSEKVPGMFGTMVVVLPSAFEGGELAVDHGGERRVLSLGAEHVDELTWAAFYADCTHELRPLTSGLRLALVFNLARQEAVAPPARREAVAMIREHLAACFDEAAPTKLVCVLEHHYTEAGLAWSDLKGPDAGRALALREAACHEALTAHLGAVSLTESWSADQVCFPDWGEYTEPGPDDVELYELFDSDCRVEGLLDAGGRPAGVGAIPVFLEELCPPGALEGEPPDEFHFHEATGNAGGTAERTYRRAAVVLWPAERDVAVLAQAGPGVVWEALTRAESNGEEERAGALLTELANRACSVEFLRQAWERVLVGDRRELVPGLICRSVLTGGLPDQLADVVGAGLAVIGEPGGADVSGTLASAVRQHRHEPCEAAKLLDVARSAGVSLDALAGGLGALRTLLQDVPRFRVRWSGRSLVALLRVALAVDQRRVVEPVVASVGFDELLVPAVVALVQEQTLGPDDEWSLMVRDRVQARASEELTPPADESREPPQTCACRHCQALGEFLRSPDRTSWTYPVRKEIRRHLYKVVEDERLDGKAHTLRTGRPYKWVVEKTDARFQARVAERSVDLETLEALGAGRAVGE